MTRVFDYSFCSVAELMTFGDVETADIDGRNAKIAKAVCVAHGAVRCNNYWDLCEKCLLGEKHGSRSMGFIIDRNMLDLLRQKLYCMSRLFAWQISSSIWR